MNPKAKPPTEHTASLLAPQLSVLLCSTAERKVQMADNIGNEDSACKTSE